MNPLHTETLLAIVDEGSFEAAATVLGITPSAVSQRIKALEAVSYTHLTLPTICSV